MVKIKDSHEIERLISIGQFDKKRIFSIVAHVDHGKTTALDFLLERAGLMKRDDAGITRKTDSDDEEQERGITIFTSVVLLAFNDPRKSDDEEPYIFQINDTPGHISFTGEVSRALRGSDGAIILVDALEGIMTQTETNIRLAVGEEYCKPVLFINKIDRLVTELKLSPQEIFTKIDAIITQINDLIKKLRPEDSDWGVDFIKNSVAVGSAKHGWGFTYEILLEKGLKPQDVFEKYAEVNTQWLRDNLPLDESLLRMVVDHLPDPVTAVNYRIPHIWNGNINSILGQALRKSDPDGPLCGMITKIFLDPKRNYQATLIGRVFSGTLDKNDAIYLVNSKAIHHMKRLGVMEITDILDIPKISAGNLFALYGFICPSGETFLNENEIPRDKSERKSLPSFEKIKYKCEPVVSISIRPKNSHDINKLINVIDKWLNADPTATYRMDKESGEFILSGIDPLQIEILTKRINNQVKIEIGEPIIVYREKILKKGREYHCKSQNTHNRIKLYVEPLDEKTEMLIESNKINNFQDNKEQAKLLREEAGWDAKEAKRIVDIYRGGILVNGTIGLQRFDQIKSDLIDAFRNFLDKCILAKEPAVGFKVVFTDLTIHEDPSHTGSSQIAKMTRSAISLSTLDADLHLFEPIQRINIKTPQGTESSLMAVFNKHRALINKVFPDKEYMRIIGVVPTSEMKELIEEIRGKTQGKAFFGYEFSHFEKIPKNIEDIIVGDIRRRKGLSEEIPTKRNWEKSIYKRT